MEIRKEPDLTNVVYIDEYPELKKRVWLRRLATERRLGRSSLVGSDIVEIIPLETGYDPDDAS